MSERSEALDEDGPERDAEGVLVDRGRGKSPAAFRTISEVSAELDVPPHVLRFWESKFPQIRPLKRGGGRRYYRPEDVELLLRIRALLYKDGYTIKGVQKLLKTPGASVDLPAAPPPALPSATEPGMTYQGALFPDMEAPLDASVTEAGLPDEIRMFLEQTVDELETIRALLRSARG